MLVVNFSDMRKREDKQVLAMKESFLLPSRLPVGPGLSPELAYQLAGFYRQ